MSYLAKAGALSFDSKDAYTTYGVILTEAGFAALTAPRTLKTPVTSESRLESGKRVAFSTTAYESREFSLEVWLTAPTEANFLTRLNALETALNKPELIPITSAYLGSSKKFYCRFLGASTFTTYQRRGAKIILKFEEPNPGDRT